jgi:TRAP-type C4-dicarboxylate transport system permease small subunit
MKKLIFFFIINLSRFMYWIAGLALTGIVFLTVADVILRAFKKPIVGTYDIVSLLGAVVIGFAIPQTSLGKGQVLMDFLTKKLPSGGKKFFHVLTRLLAIIVFLIIGWNLITLGNDLKQSGQVSMTLRIPDFPVAYGVGVCCLIECLVLAAGMIMKEEGEI